MTINMMLLMRLSKSTFESSCFILCVSCFVACFMDNLYFDLVYFGRCYSGNCLGRSVMRRHWLVSNKGRIKTMA